MKRAAIFKFDDRYIIHTDSTTRDGYGIATDPYITISAGSAIKEVTKSLLFAMEASKTDVVPPSSDVFLKQHLKFMGLKNHKELYNNSISCSIYEKDNKIVFLPSINLGLSGGFKHRIDKKLEISSNASEEVISNTLVEALNRCE